MKTLRKFMIAIVAGTTLYSCQQDETLMDDIEAISEISVSAISEEDLPEAAQSYLAYNFQEEFVTEAYMINEGNGDVSFEAFMTNAMNVVFSQSGAVTGFGEDASMVTCDGKARDRMKGRHDRRKGQKDSTWVAPVRIEITALPEAAQTYLSENYVDSLVIGALQVENKEAEIFYHVLVATVGIVKFDAEGTFIDLRTPKTACASIEELDPADLPEAILAYFADNYPDAVIKHAKKGSFEENIRYHVVLEAVGVFAFTEEGELLRFKAFRKRKG